MSFLNLLLCLTLASSTLAERWNNYEQSFQRRARVGFYPLTNSSSTIPSSSSSTALQTVDLATSTSDLTNIYMQPPRTTSSLDTKSASTFGSLDSDVESTTSTTSTSDGSNVYMQRPRTTSLLTSQYGPMPSGSVPTSYSSHPSASHFSSNEGWSSSASHTDNETTGIIPPFETRTSTGNSNFTTTFDPADCSGTMTVYVSPNAPRTRTVTETYFVTIFGVFTAPPPVSTLLPFCDTVQIPYQNTTSSTRTCSGTGHCSTLLHTTNTTRAGSRMTSVAFGSFSFQTETEAETKTEIATESESSPLLLASTIPETFATSKRTVTVIIGDITTPSFESATPVPAQPIQTGSGAAIPTQERNVPTEPSTQKPPSVDLGGIIASVFNNPFPTPETPAPSPPAGDSSNGGPPSGGTEPNRGSPEPGNPNGPSSFLAPPAAISPQNPPQHDNPVGVASQNGFVSLATSQIVVGGMTFPANLQPTTVAIEGQIISINPSQVVAPGITVNIPPPAPVGAAPSPNSPASVSIDVKSNNIVIGGHTFTAGSPPTSTVINGQTFAVNAAQQQTPGAAITAPPSTPLTMAPKLVTVANVPLAIRSGTAVIGGHTFSPVSLATSVVIDGQTFTINPSQVIGPGTTIDISSATPTNALSAVTAGGITFSVGSTAVIISGTAYAIGGAAAPMTKVIGGQTVSFGPGGVGFASTTVPVVSLSQVTAGGLTFAVGSTEAVISGTTYAIGNGASATTTVIGGQTVSFGPNGVGFASTTIPVPTMSGVTAGGLTFSVGPTAAVISGTTYAIGNGASATTAVIGGQTVSFGPNGVGFASSTIVVPTASSTVGTTPGVQLFVGSASTSSIQSAIIGTFLAFGLVVLFLL